MNCFHFINGEKMVDDDVPNDAVLSRTSKLAWVRSVSLASCAVDSARRSELHSKSKAFIDSFEFYEFLSQRRANDLRVFSFSELKAATRGFSRALMIGEGGFGCVYRGLVNVGSPDSDSDVKMEVAIKQLNRNGFQGHKEWINEVKLLGVVSHPNLVKLVGYCAEDDERGIQRLLVYEFMSNRSLEDHLLARSASPLLWIHRLRIAQDAARGLAYLHEEMDFQLIFRDLKSSNILLDEDLKAKLSDFGLARHGPAAGFGHVSTSVVGTVGYAAPEYVHTGRLTAKSDVWSFGVVLYELITGRRALERNLPRGEQKLLEWVRPYVSDSKKFHFIIDPRLEGGEDCIKSAQKLATLANKCLMKHPKNRPMMSEVIEMLENIISETSSLDPVPRVASETEEDVKEEVKEVELESVKKGSYDRRRGFDFKEMVSFRNKSIGRLDWKNWTPGLVRT